MIYDLFSGIRGWELGLKPRPLSLGIEKDRDAWTTSTYHGFSTYNKDIKDMHFQNFWNVDGIVGSPPCPPWSSSGKGEGRKMLDLILENLAWIFDYKREKPSELPKEIDLVLEPARWIEYHDPYFVALEQVPSVLPIWESYARELRRKGYSVDTGILYAEQFGYGTVRKRAFLVASRERSVSLPRGDYSRFYPHRPNFIDQGLSRPLSMADTLGWGMTHRPAPTVTAGGTSTGGAEPFGNGARKMMKKEYLEGRWTGAFVTSPSIFDLLLLHGLPMDFFLAGKKGSQFRQVGNMVLPRLGEKVLECVM